MGFRKAYEAVHAFQESIQLALSRVTDDQVSVGGGYHAAAEPHLLVLNDGQPALLLAETALSLIVLHYYRVVKEGSGSRPWRVMSTAYYYGLEDGDGQEVLAYHWHPEARSALTIPHLHLGAGAGHLRRELYRAHLPTGRIALEDFLRLAIRDFGVQPLHTDWQEVLEKAARMYEEMRTEWGARHAVRS
jgi:hypothetical protein